MSYFVILWTYKNQILTRPGAFTHKYIRCVATYGSKADILPAAGHPSQAPVVGFVPVAVVEPKVVFAHRQLKQQRHHRKPKALHCRAHCTIFHTARTRLSFSLVPRSFHFWGDGPGTGLWLRVHWEEKNHLHSLKNKNQFLGYKIF